MKKVSKFIPIDGNDEMTNGAANASSFYANVDGGDTTTNTGSAFKVCNGAGTNLPAKTSFWSKLKGILTYEIKVELTPYEQKIEDEINEFLHQEITWQGFKNFLFKDVSFGKKNKNV